MNEFFNSESDAREFASKNGGIVENCSYESVGMPDTFWSGIRASSQPVAVAIRNHAEACYGGNIEAAWNDATEGVIRGVRADFCAAMHAKMAVMRTVGRWMVSTPVSPAINPSVGIGDYRPSSGDRLQDARNWAEDAYACGDSFSDE